MNYNSNCSMHDYQIEVSNNAFINVHVMVQAHFFGHDTLANHEINYTVDICFVGSDTDLEGAKAYFEYYQTLKADGFALDKKEPNEPKVKNAIYWHTLRKEIITKI